MGLNITPQEFVLEAPGGLFGLPAVEDLMGDVAVPARRRGGRSRTRRTSDHSRASRAGSGTCTCAGVPDLRSVQPRAARAGAQPLALRLGRRHPADVRRARQLPGRSSPIRRSAARPAPARADRLLLLHPDRPRAVPGRARSPGSASEALTGSARCCSCRRSSRRVGRGRVAADLRSRGSAQRRAASGRPRKPRAGVARRLHAGRSPPSACSARGRVRLLHDPVPRRHHEDPQSLYEAARVDGAGAVREFFAVTLPGSATSSASCSS